MVSKEDLDRNIYHLKLVRKYVNNHIKSVERLFINPMREILGDLEADLPSSEKIGDEDMVELIKGSIEHFSNAISDAEEDLEKYRKRKNKINTKLEALGIEGENK